MLVIIGVGDRLVHQPALCYRVQQYEGGVAVHVAGNVSTASPSAGLRSPQLSNCFLVFCGRAATYT